MGKRSRERSIERRRLQKRRKISRKSVNHLPPPQEARESDAYNSPTPETPAESDYRRGNDFNFDSPPSSPPPSPLPPSLERPVEDTEMPLVIVDRKRRLEVRIYDPEYEAHPGTGVLRLSTEEYFRRINDERRKSQMAVKCLRNKIEALQRDLAVKEITSKMEREEAVREVREFWRNIKEGNTRSGRMVKEATKT